MSKWPGFVYRTTVRGIRDGLIGAAIILVCLVVYGRYL
jgi:hypothetical protein